MTQQKSFDSEAEFWMDLERTHSVHYRMNDELPRIRNAFMDIAGQNRLNGQKANPYTGLIPNRIQKNGPAMIVFWRDGTKTIVRRGEDEPDSDYAAFTAALGIKVFGSNSQLKKIVSQTETQKPKKQKAEEQAAQKSETLDELKAVADKFGMTTEEAFQKIKAGFQKIKEAQKD